MNAIVLVDAHWGIGKDGEQPCYLAADLKRFKELTLGHTILLGRKTLQTFPHGKPLAGRKNLILSHNPHLTVPDGVVCHTIEAALALAEEDTFVVGGGAVYTQMLPHCKRVYVTHVQTDFSADTHFPNLDLSPQWTVVSKEGPFEEQGFTYSYRIYERI